MPKIEKSALVLHSAQQMYDIVADIEAYPEFLQWCYQAKILQQENNTVIAKVDIRFKGIDQSFTTKNTNNDGASIEMGLHGDLDTLQHLSGGWYFTPIEMDGKQACKVAFDLDFTMRNKIASTIFKTVFSQIVNSQVDGFVRRAQQLYG